MSGVFGVVDGRRCASVAGLVEQMAGCLRHRDWYVTETAVDSAAGVGLPWKGPAMVDNLPWPVADSETVWLPAGAHSVEAASAAVGPHLVRLNADLQSARAVDSSTIDFSYQSTARAIAIFDRVPSRIQIDGADDPIHLAGPRTVLLPRGQHLVTITVAAQ